MYERFTDRARNAMQLADRQARRLKHAFVGTEHILLGLIAEDHGVAGIVLKNLGVDAARIRLEVERILMSGEVTMRRLPHTPRARKVIECSMEEARKLSHNYVGTEHILLGLLAEREGIAAQVLVQLGLDLADVREEVLKVLEEFPKANRWASLPPTLGRRAGRWIRSWFIRSPHKRPDKS